MMEGDVEHDFGGEWTEDKLGILRGYMTTWAGIMKSQSFKRIYMDPFAGTRRRRDKQDQREYDGSALVALSIEPPFHYLMLSDLDGKKVRDLQKLPQDKARIILLQGDANEVMGTFCADWNPMHDRGVVFLDPYGMQLTWRTMELVARTQGLDVWLWVGLDMGMNRLLAKGGVTTPKHREALTRFFGTTEWENELFQPANQQDLFRQAVDRVDVERVKAYYLERLRTIFPAVARTAKVFTNSVDRPLFMMCFAVTNPSKTAQKPALSIAESLLKKDT